MPQRFAVDKATTITYVVLCALTLAGCRPGIKSIAPVGLVPTEPATVNGWVTPYTRTAPTRFDLHWTYRTGKGAAKGRASIRIAPPDSLRFDFRGPFGQSGAAVVVGDSGLWAKPEGGGFQDILGAAPIFWAALGMPRGPGNRMQVFSLDTPERRAWRYVVATDTFDFVEVHQKPARLLAEMRRQGRVVGVATSIFSESGDHVVSSQLDFPAAESRFSITVDSVVRTEAFGPEIWRRP